MKLAEKIAWFCRDFVAILPVERAACDRFEASPQTGARGGSRNASGIENAELIDSPYHSNQQKQRIHSFGVQKLYTDFPIDAPNLTQLLWRGTMEQRPSGYEGNESPHANLSEATKANKIKQIGESLLVRFGSVCTWFVHSSCIVDLA
jgi:hypothetical protein